MLRQSHIAQIEAALDSSKLNIEDFDMMVEAVSKRQAASSIGLAMGTESILGNTASGARVKILCNFHSKFYFQGDIFHDGYDIKCMPGDILVKDNFEVSSWEKFLDAITQWADNLYIELTSAPVARRVNELDEEMEKVLKIVDELPEEYFTNEEAESLLKRLDELENKFREHIEQSEEDKKSIRAQISQLESDMGFLRASLYTQSQKSWSRSLANRLGRWANSPAGQAILNSGTTVIIKGLLEGPK